MTCEENKKIKYMKMYIRIEEKFKCTYPINERVGLKTKKKTGKKTKGEWDVRVIFDLIDK
jgi:hypothetical protein